jgi:hypothetical protein
MYEILLQADRALESGQLDQAEQAYWQLIEVDSSNAIATAGLARVALLRGDKRLARTFAERALKVDPDSVAARKVMDELEGRGQGRPADKPGVQVQAAQSLEAVGRKKRAETPPPASDADDDAPGRAAAGPMSRRAAETRARALAARAAEAQEAESPEEMEAAARALEERLTAVQAAEEARAARAAGAAEAARAAEAEAAAAIEAITEDEEEAAAPPVRHGKAGAAQSADPADPFSRAESAATIEAIDAADEALPEPEASAGRGPAEPVRAPLARAAGSESGDALEAELAAAERESAALAADASPSRVSGAAEAAGRAAGAAGVVPRSQRGRFPAASPTSEELDDELPDAVDTDEATSGRPIPIEAGAFGPDGTTEESAEAAAMREAMDMIAGDQTDKPNEQGPEDSQDSQEDQQRKGLFRRLRGG